MDDPELLAAARAILQGAADQLHALAGGRAFEVMKEVLASELAEPVRRSRCFVATGLTALLPPDSFEEPGTVAAAGDHRFDQAGAPPLPLADAQRGADQLADAILRLWGTAEPPALPDSDADDPADDAVRTAVWHVLESERPALAASATDGAPADDSLTEAPGPDADADESPLERVHDWFERTFHHDD